LVAEEWRAVCAPSRIYLCLLHPRLAPIEQAASAADRPTRIVAGLRGPTFIDYASIGHCARPEPDRRL
jgi:hypothetical protein